MTIPGIQVSPVSTPTRVDTVTTSTSDQSAAVRRSLLDESGTTGPTSSDFRPVALTTPPELTQPRQVTDQKRPDNGAARGQDTGTLQAQRASADNQTESAESVTDSQQHSGWRGFLGALTTGRISLLSGALGFLAQVFGQHSDGDSTLAEETALAETDGTSSSDATEISQALSTVSAGNAEEPPIKAPTELETKAGIGAYSFVNKLVGVSGDPQFGNDVDITFAFPFSRQTTTVDQVA